ncbi:RusA family crossover junction endodeoxyribonuclease [Falsiroseomonas ponticola]|uniref:RusA family crossover junction endodeoxyribonuclease n=1 Tax=Falsiroseomonas ponticola TaxID=2786951 RepID=UPI0019316FFD|nr:RusA family crossover junction endodeoxyribonuclease [Roseomonas ponticola]
MNLLARPAFEFQLPGPALSAHARNAARLAAWKARVGDAARAAWPAGRPPLQGDIDVLISEFSERASRDRDNMAKPICDAMQGIAYDNDRQIKHLHVE